MYFVESTVGNTVCDNVKKSINYNNERKNNIYIY